MLFSKNYLITEQIGAGAMATVSKAVQKSLERHVAVKQILSHLAQDEQFVVRFQREAKAAAGLRHENIVAIIDFGNEGDNYYIVTEYIDGPSLKQALASSKRPPLPAALSIAMQLLSGLEHSHNNGVVHRDIKPANVMITRSGIAKIMDFGIAHAADLPSLTTAGQVMGTPSYMSPEQASGKKVDHRADLFSFGIILYEMLSGVLPFKGDTMFDLIKHIIHDPHPPIKTINPSVPEGLAKLIDRALEKDVTKRFFDATEFLYAIENFAFDSGIRLGPRVIKEFLETSMSIKEETKKSFTTTQIEAMKPTTSTGKIRPTVAILPLQGCFGCHVNMLDLHDGIEGLINGIDVKFTYLMDVKTIPKVDIGIVEGCVANKENEERLLALRERCSTLVSLGTCACFGGVPGLRNLFAAEEVIGRAYAQSESTVRNGVMPHPKFVPTLLEHVKTVPDVVKTDHMIPGCPSPHDILIGSIKSLIDGTMPKIPTHAVCYECGRKHKVMLNSKKEFIAANVNSLMEMERIDPDLCFLEQGVLCMGLVTREGCGARCTGSNFPCQGCMGPAPEVKETGAKWVNTIGSLLPGGSIRFRDDLVGFSYRYTLPVSRIPHKIKE